MPNSVASDRNNVVEFDPDLESIPFSERRDYACDGRHLVVIREKKFSTQFGHGVLQLSFEILDGPDKRKVVQSFYQVELLKGRKGKGKRKFKARPTSRLVIDFAWCFGKPVRLDEIPLSKFDGTPVIAVTRTVKTNSKHQQLPKCLWWSAVESLRAE